MHAEARHCDSEQVIEVPKLSHDSIPQPSAVRRPQKTEQLVEVPTEPGYALAVIAVKSLGRRALAALADQIGDNPVPQGRREVAVRPGQDSTAFGAQNTLILQFLMIVAVG